MVWCGLRTPLVCESSCPPQGWYCILPEPGSHVSSAAPLVKQVQREQAGLAQERSLLAELRSQRMQEQVGWRLQKLARVVCCAI